MHRIFSGVQPSGTPTIGNYAGALKQFVDLQKEDKYETYYCIVNEHAITIPQDSKELLENTYSLAALYLALGIDPDKSTIFIQSQVPAHAQAGWIVACMTPLGELERMTQFKSKAAKQQSVYAGLLNYPALMVADIILYQADLVPVGDDQKQHIEMTRNFVDRFNHHYATEDAPILTKPDLYSSGAGKRIMSLQDPTSKMSKSDKNTKGYVSLLDDEETVVKKIKAAVTDSSGEISYDPENKPGVSNLLDIYSVFSDHSVEELVAEYQEAGYGKLKEDTADAINSVLVPMQERYYQLLNSDELEDVLREGAKKANETANKTLAKIEEAIGFRPKYE